MYCCHRHHKSAICVLISTPKIVTMSMFPQMLPIPAKLAVGDGIEEELSERAYPSGDGKQVDFIGYDASSNVNFQQGNAKGADRIECVLQLYNMPLFGSTGTAEHPQHPRHAAKPQLHGVRVGHVL